MPIRGWGEWCALDFRPSRALGEGPVRVAAPVLRHDLPVGRAALRREVALQLRLGLLQAFGSEKMEGNQGETNHVGQPVWLRLGTLLKVGLKGKPSSEAMLVLNCTAGCCGCSS